ncbi:MAG: fibronectin type III domain-containing protein [Ignavibacteriaceae bacterium]
MSKRILLNFLFGAMILVLLSCNDKDNITEPDNSAGNLNKSATSVSVSPNMKMIIPAYWITSDPNWLAITSEAALYPGLIYAIVNTASSGPGGAVDPNLLTKMTDFHNAGGRILVYVNTWDYPTFTPVPEATVKSDVDKWYSWYGNSIIDGVFYDQMYPWDGGQEQFYRNLYLHVKSKSSSDIVVGNPGGWSTPTYVEWNGNRVTDVICTFEREYTVITGPPAWEYQPWQTNFTYDRFYFLPHSAPNASNMEAMIIEAMNHDYGWFYCTSGTMPNPWPTLPPYFQQMCNSLFGGTGGRAPITIDGNANDWSSIPALATGTTSVQTLKATSDAGSLYLLIQGTDINSATPQFLINIDNNNSTGYVEPSWSANGCDRLIENNYLYKHNTSGWSWTQLTAISTHVINSTTLEVKIPLTTIGITGGSTIRIGFMKGNSSTERVPMNGGTMPSFVVSGSAGDTTPPTTPTGLASSNVTSSSVNLTWNASTDDIGVTGYDIYQNGVFNKNVSGTSTTMAGLNPSTAYSFYVRAKDAANNASGNSNTVNITTLGGGGDTIPPSTPTGLASSNVTSSSVNLTWNASTDDVGVTGYDIYQNGVFNKNVSGTSATMSGLSAATAYSFYVRAKDAAGNASGNSNTVNITTSGGSSIIVDGNAGEWGSIPAIATGTTAVQTLKAASDASTLYLLIQGTGLNTGAYPDFLINTDNNNTTGYNNTNWSSNGCDRLVENQYLYSHNASGWSWTNQVILSQYVRNSSVIEVAIPLSNLGISTGSTIRIGFWKDFSSTELLPMNGGTMPSYTIGGGGGDDTPPTAPGNLVSSNITINSVNLTWDASTDNVGVTGYDVYQDGIFIKNIAGTSTTMTGLNPNTAYSFYVKAKDAAGNASANSNTVNITTLGGDTEAPTVPGNLTSSGITASSLNLSWNASTDNVGVTGYDVYKNGIYNKTVTGTSTSMTGLAAGSTYSFYIRARDAAGNISSNSNTINPATTAITINGNASEWGSISALATNTGTVQTLKVTNNSSNLYLLIQGTGLTAAAYGNFYIDTDNNSATGYSASVWASNGCDYMVENNIIYQHNGGGWSWTAIATLPAAQYVENNTVIEVRVPLSQLGITNTSTIKIGYVQDNSSSKQAPAAGAAMPVKALVQ